MTKNELRKQLRQTLAGIAPAELHERSLRACSLLVESPEYAATEITMVFLSLPNEVDTTSLVLHAWQDRKRVLAPQVSWEQRRMLPIEIHSLSDNLAESPLGIREPTHGIAIPVADIDLVIVPGLGYDLQGNRIGRGRGFYDRFLAHRDWHGLSCGLALEEQVFESLPMSEHSEHDMRVDMLATDQQIRHFTTTPKRPQHRS